MTGEKGLAELMNEVEAEGYTLGELAEQEEAELEEADTGEGTGLKYFADEERGSREEEPNETDEDPGDEEPGNSGEESEEETSEEETSEEEIEETEEEVEEEEAPTATTPQWLADSLKEINPDLDIADEKAVQDSLAELRGYKEQADQLSQDLESEKQANQAFYDLLGDNNDLRDVARFMYKNKVSLSTALSAMDVHPSVNMEKLKKEDPDAYLELVEAKKKREDQLLSQKNEQESRQKTIQENTSKSKENATAFKDEYKLDSKGFDQLATQIDPEIKSLANGLVTKKFLKIMYEGLRVIDGVYASQIEEAKNQGITEGKNMKVEELMKKKQGDGLPKIRKSRSEMAEEERGDIWSKALHEETRISQIEKQS